MTTAISSIRKPGTQSPSKYSFTGPNYSKFGEQVGYVYVPQYDRYYVDPTALKKQYQEQGVLPKDAVAPSALSTLGPMLGAGLAVSGAKAIGEKIPEYLGKAGDAVGGLFSGGAATPTVVEQIGGLAPAQYGGLFGQTTLPRQVGEILPSAGLGQVGAANAGGGLFSLGGFGAGGNLLAPLGGAALGLDVLTHNVGPARGGIEGALSGAGIGSYFNPLTGGLPTGTLVGAGIGGLIGLGKGLFGNHGESHLEDKKRADLAKQGINLGTPGWEGNQAFAASRNESDLTGSDILNAADWYKLGPKWGETPQARQIEIANEALRRGLVKEHNGGIDINTAGIQDFLRNQAPATARPVAAPVNGVTPL